MYNIKTCALIDKKMLNFVLAIQKTQLPPYKLYFILGMALINFVLAQKWEWHLKHA